MDFAELVSDFAERHGIANLAAEVAPQFGASGFVQV